jgi:hypothetical protein
LSGEGRDTRDRLLLEGMKRMFRSAPPFDPLQFPSLSDSFHHLSFGSPYYHIKALDLSYQSIRDEGFLHFLSIFCSLGFPSLQYMIIRGNYLTNNGIQQGLYYLDQFFRSLYSSIQQDINDSEVLRQAFNMRKFHSFSIDLRENQCNTDTKMKLKQLKDDIEEWRFRVEKDELSWKNSIQTPLDSNKQKENDLIMESKLDYSLFDKNDNEGLEYFHSLFPLLDLETGNEELSNNRTNSFDRNSSRSPSPVLSQATTSSLLIDRLNHIAQNGFFDDTQHFRYRI